MSPLAQVSALRARSRELLDAAGAAERAAGYFAARTLVGARDRDTEQVGTALSEIADAHRSAGQALSRYASALEAAQERRGALDELLAAAIDAPAPDEPVLARVQELRDELVCRLDAEIGRAATRCARELYAATPEGLAARRCEQAVGRALAHVQGRLLAVAGPEPVIAPATRLAS